MNHGPIASLFLWARSHHFLGSKEISLGDNMEPNKYLKNNSNFTLKDNMEDDIKYDL